VRYVTAASLVALGLVPKLARRVAQRVNEVRRTVRGRTVAETQLRTWLAFRRMFDRNAALRELFPLYSYLYRLAYEGRRKEDGPGPIWTPSPSAIRGSNIHEMQAGRGFRTYWDFHRWSAERRDEFWSAMIGRLGIPFHSEPTEVRDPNSDPMRPEWLPGARLNIAQSCFRADPAKTAIVFASEASPRLRRVSYGELRRLAGRVARGLEALGIARGERLALYLPMTPASVGIYLGVILAGRCVVGISDASAPEDFEKRSRIAECRLVFTIDAYRRDGKDHAIYAKVVKAQGPRAVVLPAEGASSGTPLREGDLTWPGFLPKRGEFEAIPCLPSDPTNILFSSGTTKDPKAIPWTHTTPIKAATDAHLHHDVHPTDVLAWPTSFGWMMGPWLTYASLVNQATMALYVGSTTRRTFGKFVSAAGITMLGVVPKLVRAWKDDRTMEGLDWRGITRFSSTGEPSTPDEMLYLSWLAGGKPILEYCGGTEIGGAYVTGTMVQPCAPSTFTTPALGLDLVILDEGIPAPRGEVFLVPPSIGLSNDLLNYDHAQEYFSGVPRGPNGELLRRHGDQIERIGGNFYRHHGRMDDMINLNGVKTSSEEIRSVLGTDLVADTKPISVDVDRSGQHRLVVFAVPRNPRQAGSKELADRLRREFARDIKERLNPLLAHVEEVVLVPELPQAGPGKTKTMKELRQEYAVRREAL
jgi:acetyl-CoA synthetase